MDSWVYIENDDLGGSDDLCDGVYPVDTDEEIDAVMQRMRELHIGVLPVFVGEPGYGYKNGQFIFLNKDQFIFL